LQGGRLWRGFESDALEAAPARENINIRGHVSRNGARWQVANGRNMRAF